MNSTRRSIIKNIGGLAGILGLAACTVTKTGATTTVTINVAEITADINGASNIVKTILAFTSLPTATVTVIDTVLTGLNNAISSWNTYTKGKATITFDASSVPAEVLSVISTIDNAATTIQNNISSESSILSTNIISKIESVASDVASIGAIVSSAVTTTSATTSLARDAIGMTPEEWRQKQLARILARHGVK